MVRLKTEVCKHCGGSGKRPTAAAGQQLRKLREDKGLTLRTLAEQLGVSFSLIASIERGERRLTNELAQQMQKVLGE